MPRASRGATVDWIELGRIGAPYGIKGWLHVESHTDPPERLLGYPEWALRLASGERLARRVAEGAGMPRGWWRTWKGWMTAARPRRSPAR